MRHFLIPAALLLALAGCKQRDPAALERFRRQFVFKVLALNPVNATMAGYHQHQEAALDELWPDYSPTGIQKQRDFYREQKSRLKAFDRASFTAADNADLDLVASQIAVGEFELDTQQTFRHNPVSYVETVGNGLFTLYSTGSASKEKRYSAIVARLRALPAFLNTAADNLQDSNPVWTRVAREENQGNIELVDKTMRDEAPPSMRAQYGEVAAAALASLRSFDDRIASLKSTGDGGWRSGAERYRRKFALVLGGGVTPEELLAGAEAALKATRRKMFDLALPLHHKLYPAHRDPVDLNLIVGEVLDRIALQHSTEQSYFADARQTLEEARQFIARSGQIPMPKRDSVSIIETPVFMRGVYGVGGFSPAPVLEPATGAFYWLTPLPADWPKEKKESKLREYNRYGLRLLTLHEAIPGHYLQAEWANDIQPESRRVLRGVMGSGVYIEGWAVYATETALDAGYMDNSPELRLTFLKQQLRAIANAILDIKLQTTAFTEAEALDLMLNRTFQERSEAEAKLQRAQLDSCQLPTYFAGYREFVRLRDKVKARQGARFQPVEFHRRVLEAGPLPMATLDQYLAGTPVDAPER